MAIIVIEGVDGAGKTTLAREFEKRGFRYVHNGKPAPNEDVFETYTRQLLDAQRSNVVIDRLHVGETVYGQVVRGTSRISPAQLLLLNRLIFGLGGVVILCNPLFGYARAAWERRRDREYVTDEGLLARVHALFNLTWELEFNDCLNTRTYDPERWHDQAAAYAHAIIGSIFRRCPRGVIGSPWARYLFVGERAGGPHDLAFYADHRSSAFLNQALWDAGYTEPDMAFTNALTIDGSERDLRNFYDLNPRRAVIALGRVAQKACLRQGVPHLPAEHPQYVKRFHSRRRDRYVEKLRIFREGNR
jgi:hypothetical protein